MLCESLNITYHGAMLAGEFQEVPDSARPTVEEARFMIGVRRGPMRRYVDDAPWDERVHPRSVLAFAQEAERDGRLDRSYGDITAQLIEYAIFKCPDQYPEIVDTMEEITGDFLADQQPIHVPPRLSVALRQFMTMDFIIYGCQPGLAEGSGDIYF